MIKSFTGNACFFFRKITGFGLNIIRNLLPDRVVIYIDYYNCFRKFPNIGNPKTFNEKIAWRKLNQRDHLFTLYADKIAVKPEVAALIGQQYIIETLWTGSNPADIPLDDIEPPYVIKVSHSSGGNIFIRSRDDIDKNRIVASINAQLNICHGRRYREWGYQNIPHRVLVERMLLSSMDVVPEDYKFYVYNGKVKFIQVDVDRFRAHARNLYDKNWSQIAGGFVYRNTDRELQRPKSLEKMIRLAEIIGDKFDFVRVDLYYVENKIFFGEVTFYPEAGYGAFNPRDLDLKFGEPWHFTNC